MAIAVATPSLAGQPRGNTGRTYFVDCSAHGGGDGGARHPFADLASASRVTLGAGDQLLLRRGTVCSGALTLTGSGTSNRPVVIRDYGRGSALPRIDGQGKVSAALALTNVSNVVVENLELTNAGDPAGRHRGLYVTADDTTVSNVTVRALLVHDVASISTFTDSAKRTGGIVAEALGTNGRFERVRITGNTVHDVARQGITLYGTTRASTRPAATSPWAEGSTDVVIAANTVERTAGDGIVPLGTDGARVEHNVVRVGNLSGFDFLSANRDCSAGIWTFDANRTLIQYNEVSGMHYGTSLDSSAPKGCDGEALDVDGNQDGTVIQYNYSHDNDGGFLLLCTAGADHRADVRYNLSLRDRATISPAPCSGDLNPATSNLSGIRLYNNTFVAATPRTTVEGNEGLIGLVNALWGTFAFENNLVDATSADAVNHTFVCGSACTHNLFFGLPVPSTATNSLTADPRFVDPAWTNPADFRPRDESPALGAGAGIPAGVPTAVTRDYFGVPVGAPPPIGFAQG
jgi:hypothetical protein